MYFYTFLFYMQPELEKMFAKGFARFRRGCFFKLYQLSTLALCQMTKISLLSPNQHVKISNRAINTPRS